MEIEAQKTAHFGRKIWFSWSAVFAGLAAALAVQITLSTLGTAIAGATVRPLNDPNPLSGLGILGALWWFVSGLISIAIGAFISGYLTDSDVEHEGETGGFVMWATLTTLGFLMVLCTAGTALQAGGKIIGGTVSTLAQPALKGAGAAAEELKKFLPANMQQIDTDQIRSEMDMLVRGNSSADRGLSDAFNRLFSPVGDPSKASSKDALANLIASRSSVSKEEALRSIERWEATYNQAKAEYDQARAAAEQKVREAGQKAAKATATGAIVVFLALTLGLITSIGAARAGIYYQTRELSLFHSVK